MRKSPINYLAAIAIAGVLWVVFAILIGGPFSQSLTLAVKSPEDFASQYSIILAVGTLLSALCGIYWFWYGSQESTSMELVSAKNKWTGLFIFQVILSIVLTVVVVFLNKSEGIAALSFIEIFLMNAAVTFISFWLATFLCSPITVMYLPLFKK